jgi:hypothetical protein
MPPALFEFLWNWYKEMNSKNNAVDAPGLAELRTLFVSTEDTTVADLLKSIYVQSGHSRLERR